jgi:alanine dehydrogenase
MAVQAGASAIWKNPRAGCGILLGGVPGVPPGSCGGDRRRCGGHATHLQMAVGLGARVTVLDKNIDRLRQLDLIFGNRINTIVLQRRQSYGRRGARCRSGDWRHSDARCAAAPKLVTRAHMILRMRQGAVVVDVAIDQGGCFETSHATTHAEPTYLVDGVVHYCVANMPGAVARTSTFALNNATIGHAVALADKGWKQAMKDNAHLKNGLNVANGQVTYEAVAHDLGYEFVDPAGLLG